MNKTAIKSFAIWARNKLIADIQYKAGLMGITADKINSKLPQSTRETEFYDIGTSEPYAITGNAIKQRRSLVDKLEQKAKETNYKTAYKYVIEEVAYTWFNRLIAIRFMEVNDYLPSHIRVLSSEAGKMEPDIVSTPFDAELDLKENEKQEIIRLKNDNKLDECFRMLFVKQCNELNRYLPALFEQTSDYTELLLNVSMIDKEGVVYHLVNDIPEDDFNVEKGGQVEIIGWLYQYYNTEPKNEAFAKNGKITKEEIPAVTQLFTPDWIVRYMVENSLGRLWVEGHPNDILKSKWKYYLEEAEQEPEVQEKLEEIHKEYAKLNPADIHFIDPCMGSGHILVYAFDVLMQIYESVGYSQRDAAKSILENNLYGLDIDDRAYQMAYFAIMMKARQYNRRILFEGVKCQVYSIQESNEINRNHLYFLGANLNEFEKNNAKNQMFGILDAFKDAKEYGSILNVDYYQWDLLKRYVKEGNVEGQLTIDTLDVDKTVDKLINIINIGEIMAKKYEVVVTNPPYMGLGNGNAHINNYVKENYPNSKADLFSVFIERCARYTASNGLYSMITMHAWMFIQTFDKLRMEILNNNRIISLLHLGANAFSSGDVGSIVQTVAFVNGKYCIDGVNGSYIRLVDINNEIEKKKKAEEIIAERKNGYYVKNSSKYNHIPGTPIAYWATEAFYNIYSNPLLNEYSFSDGQNKTGNNDKYLRQIWEVKDSNVGVGQKWLQVAKGGGFRRWYGNILNIIDWSEEARSHYKKDSVCRIIPEYLWYKKGITWGDITVKPSFRVLPENMTFETAGLTIFIKNTDEYNYLLGLLNSKIFEVVSQTLNATFHTKIKDVQNMPVIICNKKEIDYMVSKNCDISKEEWNDFEISWDFLSHPLTRGETLGISIAEKYYEWERECDKRFNQLKTNEEELNRIFIDIYSLQDELSSEVEDKDVTVRKANLQRDIKSLISYAVGCMFGRYSLDVEGRIYAGGEWDDGKYLTYIPDKDNIIPITDEEYFEDDILGLFCAWLKKVYGVDTLEQNLDFIASALGNKGDTSRDIVRNYFVNDFFKDHCQTYSSTGSGKRPIYWLFDSGKQNGFKALIYLHRYNVDTIGNLRIDYLHRMQRVYESEIDRMQDMIDHSTNSREVGSASKRKEKLQKQLKECHDYDEKIGHLALSRIKINLDDGVKANYRKVQTANDGKFYEVLADSKNIMSKEK